MLYLYQASDDAATCDAHVTQSPAVLQYCTTMAQLQVLLDPLVISELHKKVFLLKEADSICCQKTNKKIEEKLKLTFTICFTAPTVKSGGILKGSHVPSKQMKTLMVRTSVLRLFGLSMAPCLDWGGDGAVYFFSHLWEGQGIGWGRKALHSVGYNMLRESIREKKTSFDGEQKPFVLWTVNKTILSNG